MKLGIVSAIYDGFTFEEAVENAVKNGCECMEVACWPQGKAERRYAGVSHIDVDNTSPEYIYYIKDFCRQKGIEISSLAFYPNTMDGNLEKRGANSFQRRCNRQKIKQKNIKLGRVIPSLFIFI